MSAAPIFKSGDITSLRAFYGLDPLYLNFKVLTRTNGNVFATSGSTWHLPTAQGLGCYTVAEKQTRIRVRIRLCRRGWHYAKGTHIGKGMWWRDDLNLYLVQPEGEPIGDWDKEAVASARLIVPVIFAEPRPSLYSAEDWRRAQNIWAKRRRLLLSALNSHIPAELRIEYWNTYINRYEAREV
jgi:hypothetical protein